jgi:hypothetical protein
VTIPFGPFVSSSDGVTPATSLSIAYTDVRIRKCQGAWGDKNDSSATPHEENAEYALTINETDTNTVGDMRIHVSVTGALPVWEDFMVLPAQVYDALVNATTFLPVDAFKPDWAISGSTLTVKKQDDSTTAYTKTLSTDASASPIVGAS